MEMQFQKQAVNCLQNVLSQVQNLELTQELRLPEGMPGAERVPGCWGQILIRSKEWRRDSIRITGGVQVWLLYVPEDGTEPKQLETWIPFQMDWDLAPGVPEGQIRVQSLLRFADARPVSAGKVLVRVGIGVLAQGWCLEQPSLWSPEQIPEDVELLQQTWPLRLPRMAGEKYFQLEEELALPPSAPRPEKLVYCRMEPRVSEGKVLANKVVFRGSGNLHVLYRCQEGQLHSWDFELPFSQYDELEDSCSADAQMEALLAVTALDLDLDEEGMLHLKGALIGQYLVDDRVLVETVTDAWSPCRTVEAKLGELDLPQLLDSRRELFSGEQLVPLQADILTDAVFLPDFPRKRREGDRLLLEQPAMVQLLSYDQEGKLRGEPQHLEEQLTLNADETAKVMTVPGPGALQTVEAGDNLLLRWELPMQVQCWAGQGIPQVEGLELGEKREPDPGRPSLILRRAGNDRLWDIAKASGSTVSAIMEANDLTAQPEPGKLLLIPVV